MIVGDHRGVRAGLRRVLERAPGVVLVAALRDGRSLMQVLCRQPVDVVVLDCEIGSGDAPSLCLCVKQCEHSPAVVLYSGHAGPSLMLTASVAQADALVAKAEPIAVLLAAVVQLSRGERLLPNPPRDIRAAAAARVRGEDLVVLDMLIEGVSVARIAEALWIAERDARARARRIVASLQAERGGDAVATPW